jgi:hypothetical protein
MTRNHKIAGIYPIYRFSGSAILDFRVGGAVQTKPYEILRVDGPSTPIWVESVASLEIAKARIAQLGQKVPGEYIIFHSPNSKIVANLICVHS